MRQRKFGRRRRRINHLIVRPRLPNHQVCPINLSCQHQEIEFRGVSAGENKITPIQFFLRLEPLIIFFPGLERAPDIDVVDTVEGLRNFAAFQVLDRKVNRKHNSGSLCIGKIAWPAK